MSNTDSIESRREAWTGAKAAVHAYARDPSASNAERVKNAWQRVRQAAAVALQRRMTVELESLQERIDRP